MARTRTVVRIDFPSAELSNGISGYILVESSDLAAVKKIVRGNERGVMGSEAGISYDLVEVLSLAELKKKVKQS